MYSIKDSKQSVCFNYKYVFRNQSECVFSFVEYFNPVSLYTGSLNYDWKCVFLYLKSGLCCSSVYNNIGLVLLMEEKMKQH